MLMKNCQKKINIIINNVLKMVLDNLVQILESAQDFFAVVASLYTSVQSLLSRIT